MADSGEDDVGGVTLAALEVATAEVLISLHVANSDREGLSLPIYRGADHGSGGTDLCATPGQADQGL